MSDGRVRSANDFRLAYRKIQADYEVSYGPKVAEVRAALADPARKNSDMEAALEAHVRTYLIDGMLTALRWVIVPSTPAEITSMIPEAQVDPAAGARRFMDYFGYEREVNQPLLVVEAKRPSKFPITPGGSTETAAETVSKWLKNPSNAPGDWKDWIPSLQEYAVSVFQRTGSYPVRAAITDGNWLVIFDDPNDAFGEAGSRDSAHIQAFTNHADVESRYDLVFRLLDQRYVSRDAADIAPGAIAGAVSPDKVVRLLHGLRLSYATTQTVGTIVPTITVSPSILLRSDSGSWLRVTRQNDPSDFYFVPYRYEELSTHIHEVHEAASALLARVQHQLGRLLQPSTLEEHYSDEAYEGMPGVERLHREGDFSIVTGKATHFLLERPTVLECPHHDFAKSFELHCQAGVLPIMVRSIEPPRAYFVSKQSHHCSHEDVDAAKHVLISEENEERCGVRSGRKGDAFCEIAPFEEFLCCRACCFQRVCTKSQILNLPCPDPRT